MTAAAAGSGAIVMRMTVQQWLDVVPVPVDGAVPSRWPLTRMQTRIWALASAGKFFEGMVVFLTGVALPLVALEFSASPGEQGMVTAAPLFGILVGATALGGLADRFGRKSMFLIEMVLFTAFLVGVTLSPSLPWLIAALFGMGLAMGCDYPTGHMMISETIATRHRGRLVLSAFAFQSIGAVVGTGVGLVILQGRDSVSDWRLMFAVAVIPALVVTVGRLFVTQSPHWLVARGRVTDAEHEIARLLRRSAKFEQRRHYPVQAPRTAVATRAPAGFAALLRAPHRRATILAAVPWFLQDLGTYGIGIFTPVILAATVGAVSDHSQTVSAVIAADALSTRGAAVIDVLLIVGVGLAILFADRVGRIRLQIVGFVGCAAGLAVAASSAAVPGAVGTVLIFAGFMVFNLMTNLGPNAMTYLIAGEVFPTAVRGTGAGFAASCAKVGAVLTAFLFPALLDAWGRTPLLIALVGTSLLGALITWRFRIETAGVSLDAVGHPAPGPAASTGRDPVTCP